MLNARNLNLVVAGLALIFAGCRKETKKQAGSAAQQCPAGYYYSATPPQGTGQQQGYTNSTNGTQATNGGSGWSAGGNSGTTNGYGNSGTSTTYNLGDGLELTQSQNQQNTVTWQQIQPIVNSRCVSCHNAQTRQGNLDLSSYQNVRNSGQAVVSSIATRRTMPPATAGGALPAADQQLFLAWQNGGFQQFPAANNTGTSTTSNGNTTYSNGNTSQSSTGGYGSATGSGTAGYNTGTTTGGYSSTTGSGNAVPQNCYPVVR